MDEFSGIVSLFIVCIEIVFFINLLIFAEKNYENRLIISIVSLLSIYQFMEFFMCYTENYSNILIYFSFIIISLLPPLILILTLSIKGVKSKLIPLLFVPAVSLLIYYLFFLNSFEITICTVLFVAYEMPLGDLYGVIYYGPIIISIILLSRMLSNLNYRNNKVNIIIVLSGILTTFVPVALIIAMFPNMIEYVESFFCKAAVIIAFTLTIYAIRNNSKMEK